MNLEEIGNRPLKSVLEKISYIEEVAWGEFIQHKVEKRIKKGETIWREGQICRHLVFLQKGLVRSYTFDDKKEVTFDFYAINSLFYDDYSFISQKPSRKTYEVLVDSEVVLIPRNHLLLMYDKYKCFERIGRISVENAHVRMIEHRERISQNSAESNYKYLLENRPYLIKTIPQKVIASYLNISTEHLSRIRSKIFKV